MCTLDRPPNSMYYMATPEGERHALPLPTAFSPFNPVDHS